ncbi:MAG: glycoside hydrolase family 65 protein [Treponema sp.]|nr:glycoside hydrolase family 65 protein [Treponema sp.]
MKYIDEWNIADSGISDDDILINGNRFLIGNGNLGYRGTVEEADATHMPATICNGLYDRQGKKWREPVNIPNPIVIRLFTQQKDLLSIKSHNLLSHEQRLNFRYGIFSRSTSWNVNNSNIQVQSERFLSMDEPHHLYVKYRVITDAPVTLLCERGIDGLVYDINGPHLIQFESDQYDSMLQLRCKTQEQLIPITVISEAKYVGGDTVRQFEQHTVSKVPYIAELIKIELHPQIPFVIYCRSSIYSGEESSHSYEEDIKLNYAWNKEGDVLYDRALQRHRSVWDRLWKDGDVIIEGDPASQRSLRFSLYHLQSIAPRHRAGLSVPARGLSGQTYKGAVFWDTELFISPYFLSTDPSVVRNFILYRIRTLPGAIRKAHEYGYLGAFYAWESQETGEDACSDFNVVDVFTGRPVRTYFKDKQIHISADIVYAIKQYLSMTGDVSILTEGAFEVILNCALFYFSYIYYSPMKNRYEVLDVIGPDEYHERVNNNAFTNYMVHFTLNTALEYINYFSDTDKQFLSDKLQSTGFLPYIPLLYDLVSKIYLPEPNENGIIEQFDGYFRLEDLSITELKKRLLDPKEYWGGANGVASHTQIIKQADVVALLHLFKDQFSNLIKERNITYYASRTEHGSSLSASMHSLVYCDVGQPELAFPYFKKTAEIDLTGEAKQFAGLIYIGGTHPAANGGSWMSVVYGFCGFAVKDGTIFIKPQLPKHWKKVVFTSYVQGKKYTITVNKDGYTIC